MTYPPARYSGQRGEVGATYRPASTEPDLTYASGGTADAFYREHDNLFD
jgi:hypothetical protein